MSTRFNDPFDIEGFRRYLLNHNCYVEYSNPNNYVLGNIVGSGAFGIVYQATDLTTNEQVAVKKIDNPIVDEIKKEILNLFRVQNGPNIIQLKAFSYDESTHEFMIIFEFVQNSSPQVICESLSNDERKYYLFQLLRALEHSHKMSLIHCDLKLDNVLFDRENKKLRLTDFGLSEYIASTSGVPIDMYDFGRIMAKIIFADKDLDSDIRDIYEFPPDSWDVLINERNREFVTEDAIDLLDKLIKQDPLNASQALKHRYFESMANE